MSTEFLQLEWLGNTVADYGLAVVTIVVGWIAIAIVRHLVIARLQQWATRTATDLDDRLLGLMERPIARLCGLGVIYLALANLTLHPILQEALNVICIVIATLFVVQLTGSLVEYGVRVYWVAKRGDATLEQSLNAIVPAIKVIVWAIGLVFLLDNLGFDISAVVASLGIGGIAIAFAAQGILGDLFSYFSILLDRPFEIGDFLVVGDLVGTVEQIGIKTTRLRSLSGEELIAANTDLTGSRIQNFKRMQRRRIGFTLGVTYETAQHKMEKVPALIRAAIDQAENVTFDRAHFSSFGDFSLNYDVVYYVETSDYAVYMDAQQSINLTIKSTFEQEGIDFAYPTQLLYLTNQTGEPVAASTNGNGHRQMAEQHN
jgi:small-conductance mechanosensitive channel